LKNRGKRPTSLRTSAFYNPQEGILKKDNEIIMSKMEDNDKIGYLNLPMGTYKTRLSARFKNRNHYQPVNQMNVMSYIPGTIIDILVRKGQKVEKGDDLIILEAMKMQNRLKSHAKGKIKKIFIKKGDKVPKGTLLIEIE
jgi:biotin carboxyl carrier protein